MSLAVMLSCYFFINLQKVKITEVLSRASSCPHGCCAITSTAAVPAGWFSPCPARSEALWAGGVNPTRAERGEACWFSTPASWQRWGTAQIPVLTPPPVDGPFCRALAAWQGELLMDRLGINILVFLCFIPGCRMVGTPLLTIWKI